MKETFIQQLIDEYNNNCQFAEDLAAKHVANIEIPVFNTLSSLSKSEFQEYIYRITPITKNLSIAEQSLIFTILMEVLTGVIKQPNFFDTFHKNNDHIILTLSKKICTLNKLPMKDDIDVIQRNIDQMQKYAQRIDSKFLKDMLDVVQHELASQKTVIQKNTLLEHMTHRFELEESVQCVDKNRNASTKHTILKDYVQKHQNFRNKTEVNLDVKSTIVLKNNANKENVTVPSVPRKRLANAFDVMTQASKAKKKKL